MPKKLACVRLAIFHTNPEDCEARVVLDLSHWRIDQSQAGRALLRVTSHQHEQNLHIVGIAFTHTNKPLLVDERKSYSRDFRLGDVLHAIQAFRSALKILSPARQIFPKLFFWRPCCKKKFVKFMSEWPTDWPKAALLWYYCLLYRLKIRWNYKTFEWTLEAFQLKLFCSEILIIMSNMWLKEF